MSICPIHCLIIKLIPLQTKRSVVDKQMEIERFQEELQVLQQEMIRVMGYYTNKLLSLGSNRGELQNLSRGINNFE